MITYYSREKSFSDDHSLAIRFADEGVAVGKLRKFPIKEIRIKTEYCSHCNAYHIVRESLVKE